LELGDEELTDIPSTAQGLQILGSEAKKIIIADLEVGILDVDAPSAKNAWDECYSKLAEFANVPFKQFQKRLADHRDQHQRQLSKATMKEILYERDKLMHIRQDCNNCGELVFDLHPAKLLLRKCEKWGKQVNDSQ
jgi:hypothetical protein